MVSAEANVYQFCIAVAQVSLTAKKGKVPKCEAMLKTIFDRECDSFVLAQIGEHAPQQSATRKHPAAVYNVTKWR